MTINSTPSDAGRPTQEAGRHGRAILRGGAWLWFQEGGEMVLAFAFTWLALRYLGAAGYGLIALTQSVVNVAALGTLNLEYALLRLVPEYRGDGQWRAARQAVWLVSGTKVALAMAVTAGLFAGAPLIADYYGYPELSPAVRVGSISLFSTALVNVGKALCLGWLRPDLRAGLSLLRRVLEVSGLLVGVALGLDLVRAVAVLAVADTLTAVAFALVTWRLVRADPVGADVSLPWRGLARRIARFSLPLLGAQVTEIANQNAGRLLIASLAPASVVGIYSVARLAADRLTLLMSQLPVMAVPVIARERETAADPQRVNALIGRLLQYQWAIGGLANLAIWAGAPLVAAVLAGAEVGEATAALRLLGFAVMFWAGTASFHAYFLVREQTGGILILNLAQLAVTGLLYLGLVPRWQTAGAAVGDVAGQAFELALGLWLVGRWYGFPARRALRPLLLPLGLLAGLLLPAWALGARLSLWLPVWALLAAAVFVSFLLRSGLPDSSDLAQLAGANMGYRTLNRGKARLLDQVSRYRRFLRPVE